MESGTDHQGTPAKESTNTIVTPTAEVGAGALREKLISAADMYGCSMNDLTVLSVQNDPFRVDTPAGHRDGAWLATNATDLGLGTRTIHLRGLHYMLLGRSKPDGTPYTNTESDWVWLSGTAGKAARWLGYIPFEQIIDMRNAEPVVTIYKAKVPWPYINVDLDIDIPDAEDLLPRVGVVDFIGEQPYKIVFFGEKSSLRDVLGPMATTYQSDLYLPTGEISDTLMHTMARVGADDGRPMIVFTFSDCDPSGWQMPISISRKLQAFKAAFYPTLDFQVRRVALTPDMVRAYGLPSTPLKATEKRGDKWTEMQGVQQTEIDALASLQPDLLRQIVRDAVEPFFDTTLFRRVLRAKAEWQDEAQEIVDGAMDEESRYRLHLLIEAKLETIRAEMEILNNSVRVDVDDFDLPEVIVPTAELDETVHGLPLVDSGWSFVEQCQALIDSKEYIDTGASS